MATATKVKLRVSFRLMEERDIKQVLDIEKHSYNIPWTYGMFFQEVTLPISHFYVALSKEGEREKVLGYAGYWLIKQEAHIVNLTVHNDYRHEGIGQELFELLIDSAKNYDLKEISLEVRCSNIPAIELYKKNGFVQVAIRPSYYQDNDEDALIMWRKI